MKNSIAVQAQLTRQNSLAAAAMNGRIVFRKGNKRYSLVEDENGKMFPWLCRNSDFRIKLFCKKFHRRRQERTEQQTEKNEPFITG